MAEKILEHFRKFIELDAAEEAEILSYFRPDTFLKKQNLIEANSKCRFHFFVVKGCLRLYFVNEKGVEQTIQFAIENWWLTDYSAFANQTTTEFTIQAVERTDVLVIDYQSQEQLLRQFPKLERYFRLIYQRAYAATQLRFKYFYDFSREAFYHSFNDSYPEFVQRVPQHLLASFLNMTPEYLSEIKSKKRS